MNMNAHRITDMDIKNPKEEDWESLPDDTAALEIYAAERKHLALTRLAYLVVRTADRPTLEQFNNTYSNLVGNSVSLESHPGTIGKRTELARAIREEADKVHAQLNIAIESYASDIKEDFADMVKTYDVAQRKLKATDTDIEPTKSKKIEVNHTRIFEMFTVKDAFQGKEPVQAVRKEIANLERLTQLVGKGVERIAKDVGKLLDDDKLERSGRDLPDTSATMWMMFNRKVKVSSGQFELESIKARGPKKYHTGMQNFWMIFGAIMFGPFGFELAKVINHDKKGNEAKVDNSLTDIHKFIRHVEGMDEIVDDLSGHVQDLVDLFKEVNESQESALNRRVVPVMELANFIMKQIVDITNGTDTLFSRLVRKHSK